MTDSTNPIDLKGIPAAVSHPAQSRRLSLVWLVPLVAALIAGWIAVRASLDRGATIQISFIDAEGIEAGKTKVRYKSVEVGTVKTIALAADLRTVNLTVEIAKFAQPLLLGSTRFWIVRPRLGASGVSGLGTLLSGAFIALDFAGSGAGARMFTGLEAPPVIQGGTAGTQYQLEAQDLGSLGVGAPAYFRHIKVGEINSVALNPDGHGVSLTVFIVSPFDRFITSDTRFWHASGVDVAVDSAGLRVQTESLTAMLAGGIAFESPAASTVSAAAAADSTFRLAANHDAAMKVPDRVMEPYVLYFDESLRGLAPGAIVDFRGVNIGEVATINVEYDKASETFRFPVLINVYPERIRSRYRQGGQRPQAAANELVARMIKKGFRAQLRTASLLTGQLYIALDFFPRSRRIAPQPQLTPMPLPTIPGNLEDLQNTIVSVAHRLDDLPLGQIARDADRVLVSFNAALNSDGLLGKINSDILPEVKSALTQARLTLAQTQQAVAPDTALQSDLHTTLTSISRAADSLRTLADYLDKHPESLIRGKSGDKK